MTVAPCATAYLIPAAMAAGSWLVTAELESSGSLYSRVTCTDRIRAPGAIPVMPSAPPAPCPCPAMRPATAVPSSAQNAEPGPRPVLAKSGPVVTVPVRSGWLPSTPVDRTATVTPRPAAGAARQAAARSSAGSHHSAALGVRAACVSWPAFAGSAEPAAAAAAKDRAADAASPVRSRRETLITPSLQVQVGPPNRGEGGGT